MTSVIRSDNSPARKRAKTNTRRSRAGLHLPVSRIHKKLKGARYSSRTRGQGVKAWSALYTIKVLAYLAGEHYKRTRMTPRYIMLVIRNNIELSEMLKDVIISQGGVLPHISKNKNKTALTK